jgi:hypothetical protein
LTLRSGTAGVVAYTDALGSTDNAFKAYSAGNTHKTGVADLDLLPQVSTDYSVFWKEYHQTAGGRKGMLLRSNGTSTYADGMRKGYLFVVENNADHTVTLRPYVVGSEQLVEKPAFTSVFQVLPGQPLWLRATARGNAFRFECSKDSLNWSGATTTAFTDNSYAQGSTDMVWGLDSDSLNWVMDNIALKAATLSASVPALDGFTYVAGNGPSAAKSIGLNGKDLLNDVQVFAPAGYEVSTAANGAFGPSLTLSPVGGSWNNPVYVRLRAGMTVGVCSGELKIGSADQDTIRIQLSGNISTRLQYTFNNDVATTYAQVPPALNVSVAANNGCTAGVATTPGSGDKALRVYSGGERNGTGALNLGLFPSAATEYSVTWKYTFGSAATEYKVGMLLRGSSPASTSTGYTAGLMQGYLFLLYHNTTRTTTEFRIYKPVNTNTSIDRLSTGTMTFSPAVNTPFWMRATVSGSSPVNLKYEYSTDSLTWTTATSTTDGTNAYTAGATQVVWGLAANGFDFFMDNITFTGSTGTLSPVKEIDAERGVVVSREFFTVTGLKVRGEVDGLKGLYIVRERYSNGSQRSFKVFYQ